MIRSNKAIFLILGITGILLGEAFAAEATEWKLARDRKGIQVYTRKIDGIAFKQFKGVVTIEHPLSSVVSAFDDLEAAERWVSHCEQVELVERISPTENFVYSYSPAPWPARDRDAVVHNTIAQNPKTGVVTIVQVAAPNKKARHQKAIRIKRLEGLWTLTPLEGGKTELVYEVLSDPGGDLPAWLVNLVSVSIPYDVLSGIRQSAAEEKHRATQFDFITNPKN